MKRCTKCGVEKDESEFHKRTKSRDGLCYTCTKCANTISRAWAKANPERKKEAGRKYSRKIQQLEGFSIKQKERYAEWITKPGNAEKARLNGDKWRLENRDRFYLSVVRNDLKRRNGISSAPHDLCLMVLDTRAIKRELRKLNQTIKEIQK